MTIPAGYCAYLAESSWYPPPLMTRRPSRAGGYHPPHGEAHNAKAKEVRGGMRKPPDPLNYRDLGGFAMAVPVGFEL